MEATVLVGILALIGTSAGSMTGIIVANRLSNYRIGEVEKKVDKHNNFMERLGNTEKAVAVIAEQSKNITERLDRIEQKI